MARSILAGPVLLAALAMTAGCGSNGNTTSSSRITPNTQYLNDTRPAADLHNVSGSTFLFIPSSGQSNSLGVGSTSPLSTVPSGDKVYALLSGKKLIQGVSETVYPTLTYGTVAGETHVTSMGLFFDKAYLAGTSYSAIFSNHGVGATDLAGLAKGGSTGSYQTILDSLRLVQGEVAAAGGRVEVPFVPFIHGESDAAEGNSAYGSQLANFISTLNNDIPQITGQKYRARLVITQVAGGAYSYARTKSPQLVYLWNVKNQQLNQAINNDDIAMAGPLYQFQMTSADQYEIHYSSASYQAIGAMLGKSMAYMSRTGQKWFPLYPTAATADEAGNVEVSFHVPVPPLKWDDSMSYYNKGFDLSDDNGPVDIVSVTISGADKVVIVPARSLRGTPHVHYGALSYLDNTQAGGALMDSDSSVSPQGARLPNYCVMFEL